MDSNKVKDSQRVSEILNKAILGEKINREEAKLLLNVDIYSKDMYRLLSCSNDLSRKHFNNRGEIYAQIGINNSPCSKNCDFCVFGEKHKLILDSVELDRDDILKRGKDFLKADVEEIFLMVTADYDFENFLDIGSRLREVIPKKMKLVANLGDFDMSRARELEKAGFTGAYHICRLGEGQSTEISKEERLDTLSAIKNSKLDLYYCVEPIGPEHTIDEILDEIFRGLEHDVSVMAVMRRIPVPNTPLENRGQISELELSKICAVTRIACGDSIRAMGVHEPSLLSLMSGANQIYAEKGCNPRDTRENTSEGRGFSVDRAKRFLWECGWKY